MKISIKLSKLDNANLEKYKAWKAVGNYAEDIDAKLTPVEFNKNGKIPNDVEEVWCLCNAQFADGRKALASAMCRGDSNSPPLLWSVWNGYKNIRLILPPAPPFVLEKEGPEAFAKEFGLTVKDIFPLIIEALPHFEKKPEIRKIKLDVSGIIS